MTRTCRAVLAALATSTLTAASLEAVTPPNSPLEAKVFRHTDLRIPVQYLPLQQLPEESAARVGRDLAALGGGAETALYDTRAGRLASLVLSVPLVPGTGVGNNLRWVNFLGGRQTDEAAIKEATWNAVVNYLRHHEGALGVDVSELSAPRIAVVEEGNIIQVYSQRVLNGILVRDSSVTAILNHGNLVLLGLRNWGDAAALAAAPQISSDQARLTVSQHAQPHFIDSYAKGEHLEYVPMVAGEGYGFRLVWVIGVTIQGDLGTWEALVDAATGALIAFEDKNQYAVRKAIGGVYPVSNDQVPPDGIEQPGWPMPFLNVTTTGGTVTTNAAGTIGCATGAVSTTFTGRYVDMVDVCGAANESSAAGDIDFGFGPTPTATDCAVPVGHSPGDTKSSRSGMYELNRIHEQARGYLPTNAWVNGNPKITANMNINQTCNAFYTGSTVNFYRFGPGGGGLICANTGEIAAVFDHEWGHGMDNFGVNPNIANPGEGIADIHSVLRLNDSCMGRNFRTTQNCPGYGDACLSCTGVRDVDWAQRVSGAPHGIPWIDANCGGGPAPCGGGVHCEGTVVAESGWDLANRDFRGFAGSVFNYDHNTALELTTRLFYIGSGPVEEWFTCTNPNGGCVATGGYLNVLAVDDDNGVLTDGTPHMTAIHAAFNRHNIACATIPPVNSGCAGGPTTAPVLAALPQDQGTRLTWGAVPNATRYYVYRTEGVNGGDFGKVKVGEVTGTSFVDVNLQNGRQYFFTVLPVGSNPSCFGLMSNSVTVTPVAGPNLGIRPNVTFTETTGDNDGFLDNCETAQVSFTVENTGTGPLTNVRLVGVTFLDHPASVLQTPLPAPIAATLADCANANGTFSFVLAGATTGQSTRIQFDVTADQLAGQVRSHILTITELENSWQAVPTQTFGYDTNYDGWTVTSGTFNRVAPGALGTPFHVSSSENLMFQCDVIRSPGVRLSATSTLSLQNNFQIEPTAPNGMTYDRANVGVVDVLLGTRTVVSPSSGTPYSLPNAPTPSYAECQLGGQAGWHANSPGYPAFAASNWSSAALNPGGVFTNRRTYLEIRYGTDFGDHREGFDFDEVVLTNFDVQVPDTQPNTCIAQAVVPVALAVDTAGNAVMEPNETAVMAPTWRNTGTNAITLTGATSNFTGPAGPVYTNPDSSASYGTIAVAAEASCSSTGNCYSVLATAATRPATHWDSTILETVTPTSSTKTWTLHIGASFTDVSLASSFYRFIETILHKNVTGGCTASTYCPTASTTREQMAVFVLVAKEPPGYVPPACVAGSEMFADVPASSGFCRWVEELARRGVVAGCAPNLYCPTSPATREQMAVFVLRTLDSTLNPPACVAGSEQFDDVPASSGFCRWIEELARRGVVTGCSTNPPLYCPTADVTREQMSVFLAVTFGLTLYGL